VRAVRAEFVPAAAAWETRGMRSDVSATGGWVPRDARRTRGTWRAELSAGALRTRADTLAPLAWATVARVTAQAIVLRPITGEFAVSTFTQLSASAGSSLPPQWGAIAGGPWSAPGYLPGDVQSRGYVSQRVELRVPMPAPPIPLGKYGRAPGRLVVMPFAQAVATAAPLAATAGRAAGVYPSLGLGVLSFFDLVRLDIARGLRDGRWRFAIDIDRGVWGVL
jgi:hypothetical protein